jgi:RNA-directed DNA polymerase
MTQPGASSRQPAGVSPVRGDARVPGGELLRGWLRAGVLEAGIVSRVEAGSPQGSPLSPLLANVALHVLDEAWRQGGQRLGQLVRYCDDFVVLCPTRDRAEQARDLAAHALEPLGLRLHPDKTQIVCVHHGAQGFDFLGFHLGWWSRASVVAGTG